MPYNQIALRAADGDLDPTFGIGGAVIGGLQDVFLLHDVAIQADGRIVVAGNGTGATDRDFVLARYQADGTLDTSFGSQGTVLTDFGDSEFATEVEIQSDGKIVAGGLVLGNLLGSPDAFGVARYNADGSLDTSFAGDGTATLPISDNANATGMAIQRDGKIVVVGWQQFFDHPFNSTDIVLVRFNADGSPDQEFGVGGKVISDFGRGDQAFAVALHDDGRIVVAGTATADSGLNNILWARYHPDGSLERMVPTVFAGGSAANAVVIQPDGKVLLAGSADADGTSSDGTDNTFVLARYNLDGSLDAGFGTGGIVTTDFSAFRSAVSALGLQRDGKIVAAGFLNNNLNGPAFIGTFALAQYNTDGSLDATFGQDGTVTTDFGPGFDVAEALAIQQDGGIVVVGDVQPDASTLTFAIARYQGPPRPHALTFFLHGGDTPGTAGGFTMNQTAPPPQFLLKVGQEPTWFSDPTLSGTFLAGATVQIQLPCTFGLSLPKTVRLSTTDADGGSEQPLGEVASGLRICQRQTFTIPLTTPATLAARRLKLTIRPLAPVDLPMRLGDQTFVSATNFTGTP